MKIGGIQTLVFQYSPVYKGQELRFGLKFLILKFRHRGYYIFIDTFLSLQLAQGLLYRVIYVTGSVGMISSAMPDCLRMLKSVKREL